MTELDDQDACIKAFVLLFMFTLFTQGLSDPHWLGGYKSLTDVEVGKQSSNLNTISESSQRPYSNIQPLCNSFDGLTSEQFPPTWPTWVL